MRRDYFACLSSTTTRTTGAYYIVKAEECKEKMRRLGQAVACSGAIQRGVINFPKLIEALTRVDAGNVIDNLREVLRKYHDGFLDHPVVAALERDALRYRSEYWGELPWENEGWYLASPQRHSQSPHPATDPKFTGMLAFAESVDKLVADRFTTVKPGRWLKRYFENVLSEKEIKYWADEMARRVVKADVKFAETVDECIRVVNLGPSESCMSAGFHDGREHWYKGHTHPAAIYATPDIHIAFLENRDGDVVARAVCNKSEQLVARIYGDARLLLPALEQLGYQQASGALAGCRINRIEGQDIDTFIMAYVDAGTGSGGGNLYFEEYDSKYWRLTTRERGTYSTYAGYEGRGVIDLDQREECPGCGQRTDPDEMRYVEWIDESRCSCCLNGDFVYAYMRYGQDYVPTDEAIYCESDGEWYAHRYTDTHDVYACVETGNYYALDDLVGTMGGYVYVDRAVKLDVPDSDGNEYATQSSIAKTHDGRTIHADDAVTHNDRIYHKDDDYDAEDERN
jgi:hypothetical protein